MFTVGSKDYSGMAYNYLVNNSFLTSHCKYVCDICLKCASDSLNKENDKNQLLYLLMNCSKSWNKQRT